MELPPSGWYQDPYGLPGLLRWWDGSTWTEHTHVDDGTDATGGAADAGDAGVAATTPQEPVPQAAVPATVQPATVQPMSVQPMSEQPTTVQPMSEQPTAGRPAAAQPTTVQPVALRGAAAYLDWAPAASAGAGPGHDANGTQVLFLGDDGWPAQDGFGSPGAPGALAAQGGAAGGDWYGYQRARRRRMWLAGALAGGTVAALAVIALVVSDLGRDGAGPAAAQASSPPAAPVATATAARPVSASPSATAGGAAPLTDGQSGLSYPQLAAPWQPTCPGNLNNQDFTWTAGESAVAGQVNVNGAPVTWYGAACSGPLPQQDGYNGVADLANTATNLANQFNGDYYSALNHTFQPQVSQPVQVSGHAGWEVKFLISYTDPQGQGLSWNDELGAVVVTDTGTGTRPAVFYVSIPGNLGESNVDALVSALQLSAAPQPAGSAPAPASPPATGSPAPGGNGP